MSAPDLKSEEKAFKLCPVQVMKWPYPYFWDSSRDHFIIRKLSLQSNTINQISRYKLYIDINPDKFQLILFGLKEDHELCIDNHGYIINMYDTVKLLGFTIDSKLSLNEHIKTTCQRPKIRLKLFQGLLGTYNPKRLTYNITHLY